MAIFRPIGEGDPENTPKPTFQSKHEEDQYYYNMKDPRTGHRYDIPMLTRLDGDYYFKHVMAMTKEELHSKRDIAVELGRRDREIDRLRSQLVIQNNKVVELQSQLTTWNMGIGYFARQL